MDRNALWIALCVSFAVPAVAAAQAAPPLIEPQAVLPYAAQAGPADLKKMYEDIEILRRLLTQRFQSNHPGQFGLSAARRTLAFSPDGKMLAGTADDPKEIRVWEASTGKQLRWTAGVVTQVPDDVQHPFSGVEGTYLRGVGVIYTITLPVPAEAVRSAPTKPAPPPLSDWERARRQVAGEPVDPTASSTRPVTPSMRETILKTLAENGHHFTHLGPNETLTVVVTFRGSEPQYASAGGGGPGGGGFGGSTITPLPGQPGNPFGGPKPPESSAISRTFRDPSEALLHIDLSKPNSAQDFELLADLLAKQDRLEDAARAYKRASELGSNSKQLAGIYRKLAQAYLKRGLDAQALAALNALTDLEKDSQVKGRIAAKMPRPVALPAQLIVSVRKGLADQFASGAIDFDQLHRGALVELRKFTDADK